MACFRGYLRNKKYQSNLPKIENVSKREEEGGRERLGGGGKLTKVWGREILGAWEGEVKQEGEGKNEIDSYMYVVGRVGGGAIT